MSFARVLLLVLLAVSTAAAADFDWKSLPEGRWVVLPTSGKAAPKVFHGGAALVPESGEVIFFGSDTHAPTALENGESNAVWRLDLKTLAWSQDYEQDPKSTWRILPDSETVTDSGRPWAMHTFHDVVYDPTVRKVVVVSYPGHARFEPEQRFPMFSGLWYTTLRPSHWEYDPVTRLWQRLSTNAPDLFARALVWDSDRQVLIGHDGARTYRFDRKQGRWETIPAATVPGWHLSLVYDTFARRVLLFGNNTGSRTLYSYDPERRLWEEVRTEGEVLPANGATMAYDTRNHVLLYLANDYENQYSNPTGKAVTFIYRSPTRRWTRLEVESPELYGMNYLMQYDSERNVFLHFEKSRETGDRIRVWAFRFRSTLLD
jgi:hypothetical protein